MKNKNRKKASAKQKAVRSPCVNICELNDDHVCIGCYRTGKEISHWGKMSRDEQLTVVDKARQREAASPYVN